MAYIVSVFVGEMMKTTCIAMLILAVLFLLPACSSDSGSEETVDQAGADIVELVPAKDVVEREAGGAEETGGEEIVTGDDLFRVGVAVGECLAPLGIPTAGYGEATDAETPKSPFTVGFGATVRQHTPILVKACYLQRGEDELLVMRLDKIGTTPELLDELTRRLSNKTGRAWDGRVILASNHSHLGPGRLWENMVGEFANDMFWPFYYDRYIDSLVDTALLALADAEPAQFGYGKTECPECHNDRRCENPELLDSTLWVVRFDRTDGSPKAIWLDFAIHGTVFGWKDFVLSGDAPGMMEHKLEETFASPVDVFMFQSWGGDVSPADPDVAVVEPVNGEIPGNYSRLERIGFAAAQHIVGVLPEIETTAEVEFRSITLRPPISYELMDYEEGEFDYPNGGMMCGSGAESHCWGEEGDPPDMACIPMPEAMAPDQFVLSAFSINDLLFFTLPGEPHTDLSLETVEAVQAATGWQDVVVVGYAQDHWGYILKSYDWLLGGYEPTVSFWGPAQGDYIAARVPHVVSKLLDPNHELPFDPLPPLAPLDLTQGDKYTPQNSVSEPAMVQEPAPAVGPTAAAVVVWAGGDPWLGTPRVELEREDGGEWAAVTLVNGKPFDNRSFHMETSLEWVPGWKEDKEATSREFLWKVVLPAKRNVPTPSTLEPGTYRLKISGSARISGIIADYELHSGAFELE
jgi:neutral ceramidase